MEPFFTDKMKVIDGQVAREVSSIDATTVVWHVAWGETFELPVPVEVRNPFWRRWKFWQPKTITVAVRRSDLPEEWR